MSTLLCLNDVSKSFTVHLQGGIALPVIHAASLSVARGECVVLGGPSGAGKSTLLRMVYGNYRCSAGQILICAGDDVIDMASADPRRVLGLRRHVIGYVSQFLRVIPRVSTLEVVAEPAIAQGFVREEALERATELLKRLNVPQRLWLLPPATFSGGEQQRVNIARGFAADHALLLLDEPTASLDAENRAAVVKLIREKLACDVGMLAIFHDEAVREEIATRIVDVTAFSAAAAA